MIPSVGEIYNGYRFLGGNPNDETSWEQFDNNPREGDIIEGYRFKGGSPNSRESWETFSRPSPEILEAQQAATAGEEYWTGGKKPKVAEIPKYEEYQPPVTPEEQMAEAQVTRGFAEARQPSITETLPRGEPVSERPLQMPARPFQPRMDMTDALMLDLVAERAKKGLEETKPAPIPTIEAAKRLEQERIMDFARQNVDAIANAQYAAKKLFDEYPDLGAEKEQSPLAYATMSAGARFVANMGDFLWRAAESGRVGQQDPDIGSLAKPEVVKAFDELAYKLFPKDEEGKAKRLEIAERFSKKSEELAPAILKERWKSDWSLDKHVAWLGANFFNQADSILLATGAILYPPAAAGVLPIIASSSAGGTFAEDIEKGVPVQKALWNSFVSGAAEASFEGVDLLTFRVAGKALKAVMARASEAERQALAASYIGKGLKGIAVTAAASAGSAASESLTTLTQNLSTKYIAERDPGDIKQNILESAIIGGFLGPFFTAASAVRPAIQKAQEIRVEGEAEQARTEALRRWQTEGIQPSAPAVTPTPIPPPVAPPVATRTMEQARQAVESAQDLDTAIATADQLVAEVQPARPAAPVTPAPAVEAPAVEAPSTAQEDIARRIALIQSGAEVIPEAVTTQRIEAPVTPVEAVTPPRIQAPPTGRVEAAVEPTTTETAAPAAPEAAAPVTPPAPEAPAFDNFLAPRDIPSRGIAKGEVVTFPTEKQALAYAREQKVPETYAPREVEGGFVLSRAARAEAPATPAVEAAAPRAGTAPEQVSIPIGKSTRATVDAPRIWYHDPRGRGLNAEGGITGYPLPPKERELSQLFRGAKNTDGFVYLSPTPLSASSVAVDISQFPDRVRLTGQAEGYAIVRGDIPATSVSTRAETAPTVAPESARAETEIEAERARLEANVISRISVPNNMEVRVFKTNTGFGRSIVDLDSGNTVDGSVVRFSGKDALAKVMQSANTIAAQTRWEVAPAAVVAAPTFTDATAPKKTKRFQKGEVVTFASEKQAAAYAKAQKLEGYTPREVDGAWRLSRSPQGEITVGLSAATQSILGISELYKSANAGDELAHTTLQLVAEENIKHLLSRTNAKVITNATTGLYGGAIEPSLTMSVTFDEADRASVLAALAKFASNFNQEQIHVRVGSKEGIGFTYDDGSYVTPVYRWSLERPLSRKEIENVIEQSGLYGLTFSDSTIEAYFVGDPLNEGQFTNFEEAIARANGILEGTYSSFEQTSERLWAYGDSERGLGFDTIQGDVPAGEGISNETARKIAAYLNAEIDVATGRRRFGTVRTFEQQDISPQQEALQTRIAEAYDAMPVNDLDNPNVRRAYEELADEVLRQYKAIPTKVEVYSGKAEPYKSSEEMRRDLLDNNHLFIYATTPETFGPPGQDFADHPLLKDSGLKDQNGYRLLFNDLLRAVHDYYAHSMSPVQFGPKGEEAAWRNHMAMTRSPWARWALTAETRGQNSWVNFRPDLDRTTPAKDRPFAEQKAALLPLEFSLIGDNEVDAPVARLMETIGEEASQGSLSRQQLGEESAIQKPSPEAVSVLPRTRGGEEVGQRDTEGQEVTGEGRVGEAGAEEVIPQATFENLNRPYTERAAFQGYEQTPGFIQPSRRLRTIIEKLDSDKISEGQFIFAMRQLSVDMSKAAQNRADVKERERGADIVREKLIAARRRGELDSDLVDFALWLLDQNPGIAAGLGISVKGAKDGITSGQYNPANSVMTVFKQTGNIDTGVHEILHHSERMMPKEVQAAIRAEWEKAYGKALANAKGKERDALLLIMDAMAGSPTAKTALLKAFKDGTLDYDKHYHLTNPSEFWAVKALTIMRQKYEAGSWIAKAKNWLSTLVEKAKAAFGLRSDAPIIRGLEAVMSGKAVEPTGVMLSSLSDYMNIEGTSVKYSTKDPTNLDLVQRTTQDRLVDLKKVEKAVEKTNGPLIDALIPSLQAELYYSRLAQRNLAFNNFELLPLEREIASRGLKQEEVEEYLHARHAPSRNRVMAKRNPNAQEIAERIKSLEDGIKKAKRGSELIKQLRLDLNAWKNVKPFEGTEADRQSLSGMSTEAAQQYMNSLEGKKKADLEAVAAKVDAMVEKTKQTLIKGGVDGIDSFNNELEYYVPLRREGFEEQGGRFGSGFAVKGKTTKMATGSTRQVVDILASIAMARYEANNRVEKNRVANSLVGLAQLTGNNQYWAVEISEKEPDLDSRTGTVVMRPKRQNADITARVPDGKGGIVEHVIYFNKDNPTAVLMGEAMKGLDVEKLNILARMMQPVTRYYANINTQWNPLFGGYNFVRDLEGSIIQISDTPIDGRRKELAGRAIKMIVPLIKEFHAQRLGKTTDNETAKAFRDFQSRGGPTAGFRGTYNREEEAKRLANHIRRLGDVGLKGMTYRQWESFKSVTGYLIADYNNGLENAIRLAAYQMGLEQGMTKDKAALMAKDITVNFDRKGTATRSIGAAYAFFNPAAQQIERMARLFEISLTEKGVPKMGKRGQVIVGSLFMLGVAQAVAMALGDLEEDEVKKFVKEKNFVIPIQWILDFFGEDKPADLKDKSYITLPMALGYNSFVSAGRIAGEWVLSGFKDPGKRVMETMGVFIDSFNPLGSASLAQTFAPTAIDPFVALIENKDWLGNNIFRNKYDKFSQEPGWLRARDNASKLGVMTAIGVNWFFTGGPFGGTIYTRPSFSESDIFSPTPDQIDYLIGQATGGIGRESVKLAKTVEAQFTGEQLPPHARFLSSRFYGEAKPFFIEGEKFYRNVEKLNRHVLEIKGREEAGIDPGEYMAKNPESLMRDEARSAMREVQNLRKERREKIKAEADKEEIRDLEYRITQLMADFNNRVDSYRQ